MNYRTLCSGAEMRQSLSNHSTGGELNLEFMDMATRLSEILADAGCRVRPYVSPALPVFSTSSVDVKRLALSRLKDYLAVCEATLEEGFDIYDSKRFLWVALKQMGLVPCSDVFEKITDDHVIEIYTADEVQCFRNLRFFEICSYTLEELYTKQWIELYRRPDEINAQIAVFAKEIFVEGKRQTLSAAIGEHILEEVSSPFSHKIKTTMPYLSPLFGKDKRVYAALVIETAEVVGKPLNAVEQEQLLADYWQLDTTH